MTGYLAIFIKEVCSSASLIYRVVDWIYSAATTSPLDLRFCGLVVVVRSGEGRGWQAHRRGQRRCRGLVQIPNMRPTTMSDGLLPLGLRSAADYLSPASGHARASRLPSPLCLPTSPTHACAWAHPPPLLLEEWEKGRKGEERS